MVKRLLLAAALALVAFGAAAQSLPNNSLAVGRGPGVAGFKSVGPCVNTTQVVTWVGGVPTCTNISAFTPTVSGVAPIVVTPTGLDYEVSLTTVPISLGGTNLTAVGTSGLPLVSDGTGLAYTALDNTAVMPGFAHGQILYYDGSGLLAPAGPYTGLLVFNGAGAPSVYGGTICDVGGVGIIQGLSSSGSNNCAQLVAGSNVTITPDGGNPNLITIAATGGGGGSGCNNPGGTSNVYCGTNAAGMTGTSNTAIGEFAGTDMTTGVENTVGGYQAGANITTSPGNTLYGAAAGFNITTVGGSLIVGSHNTYLGYQAGFGQNPPATITGGYNVGVGVFALQWNTEGEENVAVGATACLSCTGGGAAPTYGHNIAIGGNAMGGNLDPVGGTGTAITGGENTVVGYNSGIAFRGDIATNTCIGAQSCGATSAINTTGSSNTSLGWSNLFDLTTGTQNLTMGYATARDITTGSNNILIGMGAGEAITTGSTNILIINNSGLVACPVGLTNAVVLGGSRTCSGYANSTVQIGDGNGNNRLLFDSSGVATLSNYTAGGLVTNASGVVSAAAGTTGTVMIGTTGSAPSFSADPVITSLGWTGASPSDRAQSSGIVANLGTVNLTPPAALGTFMFIFTSTGEFCGYTLNAGLNTTTEIFDPSNVCGNAAAASQFNFYFSGANYIFQNNAGSNRQVHMRFFTLG